MIHRNRKRLTTGVVAVCILLGGSTVTLGQVRVGVGMAVPGLSIGISIPAYPDLVPIPGYPVYYDPGLNANLFFYDGLYWVFVEDDWYYSSWYDGPWYRAEPQVVPDFILRVPILYYRRPPAYFIHWNRAAPPRWGEHWGRGWEDHRRGWDRWDRTSAPPRAPLPSYQRRYPRGRYPGVDRQRTLENRYYHYRPRDARDRSRLEQSPQLGRRIAPQPNRPPSQHQAPAAPPNARRALPGTRPQRPPVTARPSPPARGGERPSDTSRPSVRPGARPAQPRSSGQPGRQEQRNEPRARGEAARAHRPPERPPE